MNHFLLFTFVVAFICVEHHDKIYRLTTELQSKIAQLEAKKLKIMESELYRRMNDQVQSLESERDQLYAQLLEASQVTSGLRTYKSEAEKEMYKLRRNLEMEQEKLHTAERELRYANEQVDKLRVENSEANRKIDRLEDKIRNDPRNWCTCICSSFDAFRFCTYVIYRMATYFLREYVGSSLLLTALDFAFDLLKPHAHHLQIE